MDARPAAPRLPAPEGDDAAPRPHRHRRRRAVRLRDRPPDSGPQRGAFAPSEGSLYPTLHRLEQDGALTATWRGSERGPRRRYYRLTPKGHGLLQASLEQWTSFARSVERVALGDGSNG